jgi:ubiquinone/menaquinone biosynthesis C-methylase UbiE
MQYRIRSAAATPRRDEMPERDAPARPPRLTLDRAAYRLAQRLRTAWFSGHYALTARLSPSSHRKPRRDAASDEAPKPRLPSWQTINDDLADLFRRDWRNIEQGYYRLPHDMWPNPGAVLRQSVRYFRDLEAVNRRRRMGGTREVSADGSGRYPRYYLQNFHYQTDGYLSPTSAGLYDYQVEVLFTGGADAMRRQLLVPLRAAFETTPVRQARMVDIACGTGRFLRFVKDNYPRLHVTGVDLSAPYLTEARRRLRPWSRTAVAVALAEQLPFATASVDVASCIFLFHELPRAVRRRAAAEMARVLRPGGLLLFMDSIQHGDRPDFDPLLDRFPQAMHEPYYADYIRDDLRDLFARLGFAVVAEERAFFARMMVLRRNPG